MKSDRWTRRAMLMLVALTAVLSGCTTYVTTQVTAFSDWSGNDASRTYAFTRSAAQQNSLEQATYELLVANELATHAFRQVDAQQAHYLVGLSYGTIDLALDFLSGGVTKEQAVDAGVTAHDVAGVERLLRLSAWKREPGDDLQRTPWSKPLPRPASPGDLRTMPLLPVDGGPRGGLRGDP